MAQYVKPLTAIFTSHNEVLFTVFPEQNALGKAVDDGSSIWAPATHVGDSDGVADS